MRKLLLLACFILAACDEGTPPPSVKKDTDMDPLITINARLAFTCKHETLPEASAESDILFNYARWLQKNNQLNQDEAVDTEVGRLYRIAAENGHAKATINLLNGSLRGHFALTGRERLRFAQRLIDARVASGYYFIAIYLQHGAAGLQQDDEMALRYYRKAADEGNAQAQAQSYVAGKLFKISGSIDVVQQLRHCAAEQGDKDAASALGVNLKGRGHFKEAVEVFQVGVMAGDEMSAFALEKGFEGPLPNDTFFYLELKQDPERVSRYKRIGKILGNYSYASPTVPEINDIVPLPPAPLPAWDGKLKWLEERRANIPPTKPSEALIAGLAEARQLNPATGR